MAEKLIDSLAAEFDPSSYRDEYREELLSLIEQKAEGKEVVTSASKEPEATKAPDLMAALEESIAAVRGSDLAKEKPKPRSKSRSGSKSKSSTKSSNSKPKSPPPSASPRRSRKSRSKSRS